jgi:hypothetical protein
MGYMVERDGGVVGPYSRDDLKERLESGQFVLTDMACDQESGHWKPLSALFQLSDKNDSDQYSFIHRLISRLTRTRRRLGE